ncbi:Cytochrome c oxidase subunit 7A [Tolypocladium capitatum]|uniref:Cytochrome c oxidase subunit 9, mitochondrial n=1 Tax=Tolypocladium capitatum TaxID=45235 RepID=A0A2K3QPW6_9HYPO|nr:Cytochrome c oxidase subunit 7A [Tolypocladium capitatum]
MAIKPITGILRRRLILDLTIGLGAGVAMANWFWYGFHMPRTNLRDAYYNKLEEKRATEKTAE